MAVALAAKAAAKGEGSRVDSTGGRALSICSRWRFTATQSSRALGTTFFTT